MESQLNDKRERTGNDDIFQTKRKAGRRKEEGQEENMDFPVSCRHIYHGNRHRNFLLDKARK